MMTRMAKCALILLMVGIAGANVAAADCGYGEALRAHWKRTRGLLIPIVAAMPEAKYDFRPTKGVRSFREMVEHMITDAYSHIGFVAGKSRAETEKLTAKYANLKTRAEYLKAMEESYDYGDKILADLTDKNAMDMVNGMRNEKMTRVEAALVAFEDAMDHYGNLVVYLRLNGIVPPDTANRPQNRQPQQSPAANEHQH